MSLTEDEIIRARRVLDLISPTKVVEWASDQLAAGRDDAELIELAATYDHSAVVVDGLLDDLLGVFQIEPPDEQESVLYVAYAIARDILNNRVAASRGAQQIARAEGGRTSDPIILGLVSLADDWDDGLQTNWEGCEGAQGWLQEQIRLSAAELVESVDNPE
jgi:hypothetical protein